MRRDGVRRQLDLARKSAESWPQHKLDEARRIFQSLAEEPRYSDVAEVSIKWTKTVSEQDTVTDTSFAGIPMLLDDQVPPGAAYLLDPSAFFRRAGTLYMKHPDGQWKPILTFPKVTIKTTWNP